MLSFRIRRQTLLLIPLLASLLACQDEPGDSAQFTQGNTPATDNTARANAQVREELDLANPQDFENASRGLIASPASLTVPGPGKAPVWDMPSYDFIQGEAPDTVNPSLWRQATLNNHHGLFKVTEGVYQLRGFDLSNMSIIEGRTGWIIVDPLTTKETAGAAIAFAREHLGNKPISAIIFTHSHVDHFGGVQAVLGAGANTEIVAPVGFMDEATSENVIAGTTMSRRSMFMYGSQLEHSARGHVGSGLGKGPAFGSVGIAQPTRIIDTTGEIVTIDGVEFIFQNAPGSEAPAELTFYLPELKAFCGAEVVSRNMHNLYTLRGTKVRDARKWSHYIDQAINLFPDAEVYFGSHHWPLWGNTEIIDFLKKQRDGYKYIHDQTLRLASQGYTPREIADMLQMPEALRKNFPNRGYYGTLKHNAKAVYQMYFGWYDGNPANLDPLPPTEAAVRYVDMMGGADAILERAQEYFDDGDYRWVAELLNHLVFAEPDNTAARELLASTYDQMGYLAESGPWRDVYLTGALELRQGTPEAGISIANAVDLIDQTPLDQFFELMGAMLNGPKADGKTFTLNIDFTDLGKVYVLELENAVLHQREGDPVADANATVRITHPLFVKMLTGRAGVRDILFSDDVSVEGSKLDLLQFFALLDQPNATFNIVTP
ncbi:MAG: MBL fold metallo-hydrolase [Halioglobus sp.]|nr:MBL fold metallo-hydrolase [Halioglobus sp.]